MDILDVQQGNVSGVIAGLDPLALVLSPDETSLYVVTEGQSILRVDLATKRILAIGTVPLSVNGLVFNPTRPVLYATAYASSTVLDPASLAAERSFKPCDVPTQLVPSPDGATLYIACENGSLLVYDAATETLESSVAGADGFGAAMTPDATQLWVTQPGAGTVAIVDLATNAVRHVSVCNSPRRIAFAMDGSAAAITCESGSVAIVR